MSLSKEIEAFFDQMSKNRNQFISQNPYYDYEQKMRQKMAFTLLMPCTGDVVLDIGSGNLRDSIPLANIGLNVYSIDLSLSMLKEGIKNKQEKTKPPHCIQGSVYDLPYLAGSMDKILCSEVIEHIPYFEDTFDEFHRC